MFSFITERVYRRSVGRLSVTLLLLKVQLEEYRGVFKSLSQSEPARLPTLMKTCPDVGNSYKAVTEFQSRVSTLDDRLAALRLSSQHASRVTESAMSQAASMSGSGKLSHSQSDVGVRDLVGGGDEHALRLQTELEMAKEELGRLSEELFQATQAQDRTPGALLFLAALQEDGALDALRQLALQLAHFKSMAEGGDQMDVNTLGRRMQVCVENLPSVEKFLSRYEVMYQRWNRDSYRQFAARNRSGGGSSGALCPLCHSRGLGEGAADGAAAQSTGGGEFLIRGQSALLNSARGEEGVVRENEWVGVVGDAATAALPNLPRRRSSRQFRGFKPN